MQKQIDDSQKIFDEKLKLMKQDIQDEATA